MRVMLDTNVLISALILRSKMIDRVIKDITMNQELLLSTFVIDEFKAVVALKWPNRKEVGKRTKRSCRAHAELSH